MRVDGDVCFEESGVAQERGAELSAELGELIGGGEDQRFVSSFVVGEGGCHLRRTIRELHDGRDMKNVLVKAGKVEDFISLNRAADTESELILFVWIFFPH